MAVVSRYFSTSSAGSADGTSWANRAALFSAGNWSTVITGFDFSGSDSLKALIGPGTYTCSQALASGLFSNAPTIANPLLLHGCDGSGVTLEPENPDWTSDMPVDWDTALPVIATTTNINTINLAQTTARLLKFTSSGTTTAATLNTAAFLEWIVVEHSGSNTAAFAIGTSVIKLTNSAISMSGSSYRAAVVYAAGVGYNNIRGQGVTGSSGNRHGIELATANINAPVSRCTFFGFGGDGFGTSASSTSVYFWAHRCVFANNGGSGIKANGTASQVALHAVAGCMLTGNGAYGLDAQSAARVVVTHNRLRDNATANFNGLGNYPTDLDNFTTDSDDASEYVNAGSGDFRIKNTAAIWGQGYGVSDEAASASGGASQLINSNALVA